MAATQLQHPVLDNGLSAPNFFTGRLLTAHDLTRERVANREIDRRLGRALGAGVAYGLEVSVAPTSNLAAPTLQITPGLAVNRLGQTLQLHAAIDLALVRTTSAATNGAGFFSECQPLQTGTYVAGQGVYLLTIAPAESREGRAPTSGLGNEAAACNTDTIVETVQFRLLQLNSFLNQGELSDENLLRNRVAYRCFGVTELNAFTSNPFGPPVERYGLLDELRDTLLTDCDVPLALIYWTLSGGIEFVDMWAVRRRLTQRALADPWSPLLDDRRASEGEAMFLQFQGQMDDLFSNSVGSPSLVVATNFRYLPPVGVIPEAFGAARNGFPYQTFFAGVTYRAPVFIEGARIEPLMRQALRYTPLDLTSGEMLWLYRVRENRQTINRGGANTPQSYLIFASGHLPFWGEARFDVARWDYSNYSSVLD